MSFIHSQLCIVNAHLKSFNRLSPLLGVSIAMLLAFRTNRAFERYWYGAQQWTTITSQVRNLARICWNGINASTFELEQEKLATMKLIFAIVVATKHTLRGEDAFEHSDFTSLLPLHMLSSMKKEKGKLGRDTIISYKSALFNLDDLPEKHSSAAVLKSPDRLMESPRDLIPELNPTDANTLNTPGPYMRKLKHRNSSFISAESLLQTNVAIPFPMTRGRKRNATFDLIHRVSYYMRRQRGLGHLDPEDSPSVSKAIEHIIDALTKFDQLILIPVPKPYATHIHNVLSLYFLAMPFQLVRPLGIHVVWVTMVTCFAFFGAEAIAQEIEDPFGMDTNDLPIADFCAQLKEDIEYIMERPGFFQQDRDNTISNEDRKTK